MLQKNKNWIALLCCMVILLLPVGCAANKTVATIDGDKITRAELDLYTRIMQLYMPGLDPMLKDAKGREALDGLILDNLIYQRVVEKLALQQGITVSSEELDLLFEEQKQSFPPDELTKKMQELKISTTDFKSFLAPSVMIEKIIAKLAADLTTDEIRAYLLEYPIKGLQLELSHILVKTEAEAQAVVARIHAGEDFKDLAAELSVEPNAASSKGYLGLVPAESELYDKDFLAGANLLAVGEISPPVKSQFGYHVIYLHEKTEPTTDEVRSLLAGDKFEAVYEEFASLVKIDSKLKR